MRCDTVFVAGCSAELVQQDKRLFRRIRANKRRFLHLKHERGNIVLLVIGVSNASADSVKQRDRSLLSGNVTPDLRQNSNDGDLFQVCGFPAFRRDEKREHLCEACTTVSNRNRTQHRSLQ